MKQKRLVFHFKALKKTYFAFTLVQLLNSDQEKKVKMHGFQNL